VGISSLLIAFDEALAEDALTLEPTTSANVQRMLRQLTEKKSISRREAQNWSAALLAVFSGHELHCLFTYARKHNYAHIAGWLGGETPTTNPFHDPESLPGRVARNVLAILAKTAAQPGGSA
jgi:hypothetical protein